MVISDLLVSNDEWYELRRGGAELPATTQTELLAGDVVIVRDQVKNKYFQILPRRDEGRNELPHLVHARRLPDLAAGAGLSALLRDRRPRDHGTS